MYRGNRLKLQFHRLRRSLKNYRVYLRVTTNRPKIKKDDHSETAIVSPALRTVNNLCRYQQGASGTDTKCPYGKYNLKISIGKSSLTATLQYRVIILSAPPPPPLTPVYGREGDGRVKDEDERYVYNLSHHITRCKQNSHHWNTNLLNIVLLLCALGAPSTDNAPTMVQSKG